MKHVPSNATKTQTRTHVGVAVLVGAMGLAAIAAAATGLSRADIQRLKNYVATKPVDVAFTLNPDTAPIAPPLFAGSPDEYSLLTFTAKNSTTQGALLKELAFYVRPAANAIGAGKKDDVPGCGLSNVHIEGTDGTQIGAVATYIPTSKLLTFTNLGYTIPSQEQRTFVVKGIVPAGWTTPEKQQGCAFTFALRTEKSSVMGTQNAEMLTLSKDQIVGPKTTVLAVAPTLSWALTTPAGASAKSIEQVIGRVTITNTQNAFDKDITIDSLPLHLQTTMKPPVKRIIKIYKDEINPANLISTLSTTAPEWKNGEYNAPASSAASFTPSTVPAGSSINYTVTMDTTDAQPGDTLIVNVNSAKLKWQLNGYTITGLHPWFPTLSAKSLLY